MGVIIFLIIVVIVVMAIISIVTSNFKYRAKQHVLKNTGASSSDISAGINGAFEKKSLQKLLTDYPNFTEESIKELLKQYTEQIFNRNSMSEFSQTVCEKMQKDNKLDAMKNMEYRRTNINYYKDSIFSAIVVYTDGKDEYNVNLQCSISGDKIQINKYQIARGAVVGF